MESLGRMEQYGSTHIAVLVFTVVAAVVLVAAARRMRGTQAEGRALAIVGWILLITSIAWIGWEMLPGNWDTERSLPFHLCDALRIITALALITRAGWAIAICYYWGLTLNIQSVLTPDLNYSYFIPIEFGEYWFVHITSLIAPIVFIWGLGYRPTWRGYAFVFVSTLVWAGMAGIANALTGANYMYLARTPAGASALDLLGPWPVYIVWEILLIAGVWALMTWPWQTARAASAPLIGRLGAVRRVPSSPAKNQR